MYRRAESILVVIIGQDGRTLLLKRREPFTFWQSVTGSLQAGESTRVAAFRELKEETGLTDEGRLLSSGVSRQFNIDSRWRDRFAPGAVENVEYEFHYCIDRPVTIRMCDDEHSEFAWLALTQAMDRVWSWTNRAALEQMAVKM